MGVGGSLKTKQNVGGGVPIVISNILYLICINHIWLLVNYIDIILCMYKRVCVCFTIISSSVSSFILFHSIWEMSEAPLPFTADKHCPQSNNQRDVKVFKINNYYYSSIDYKTIIIILGCTGRLVLNFIQSLMTPHSLLAVKGVCS